MWNLVDAMDLKCSHMELPGTSSRNDGLTGGGISQLPDSYKFSSLPQTSCRWPPKSNSARRTCSYWRYCSPFRNKLYNIITLLHHFITIMLHFYPFFTYATKVHASLRIPLLKQDLAVYQGTINDLLTAMMVICAPFTKSKCRSIKYHWPHHCNDTRRELSCAAHEKSLERKLAEAQKRNFKFTNGRYDVEVQTP